MPIYERAPIEVIEVVDAVHAKYHGPQSDAGVEIDVLFASPMTDANGDPKGNAVTVNGYKCAAKIRVTSLQERVMGRGDAELTIDRDWWEKHTEKERHALVDHECCHLELALNTKGVVKRDDHDRPKLTLRKHDHQFGWFDAPVRRHGMASTEAQQFTDFCNGPVEQLWLPFMDKRRTKKKTA